MAQFSPPFSSENVGDDISQQKIYPQKYELLLDLHGEYEYEAISRTENFLQKAKRENFKKIRILTGKGEGILFSAIKRLLNKEKERKIIYDFKDFQESSFDVFL